MTSYHVRLLLALLRVRELQNRDLFSRVPLSLHPFLHRLGPRGDDPIQIVVVSLDESLVSSTGFVYVEPVGEVLLKRQVEG